MTVEPRGISPFQRSGPAGLARGLCLGGLLVLLLGCYTDRTNTISRTTRMRQIEAERAGADRVQRELGILRQLAEDARDSIDVAKTRSVQASAQLRAVLAELDLQLVRLKAAEEDLAASRQRAAAIAEELQPQRELQAELDRKQQRHRELSAQLAAIEPQLAAVERQLAERQAALQPKLDELEQQLAKLAKVEAAIAAAQAAAGALVVPAKVTPAAPEQPKK